jgi:hypothetical protein
LNASHCSLSLYRLTNAASASASVVKGVWYLQGQLLLQLLCGGFTGCCCDESSWPARPVCAKGSMHTSAQGLAHVWGRDFTYTTALNCSPSLSTSAKRCACISLKVLLILLTFEKDQSDDVICSSATVQHTTDFARA